MANTLKDISGTRFGRLLVVGRASPVGREPVLWCVTCDCGTKKSVRGSLLRSGKVKSCGCIAKEKNEAKKPKKPERETRKEQRLRIESYEYLNERFFYDAESGLLQWKTLFPGRPAGTEVKPRNYSNSYVKIALEGVDFKAHRIAWILATKDRIPAGASIDHINGCPTDNRLENLRLCTAKENARNSKTPKSSSTKLKGVSAYSNGKYRASIVIDRKQMHLGVFDKKEDASRAYILAAKKYFGEFACIDR